jgi:hypothetical protein
MSENDKPEVEPFEAGQEGETEPDFEYDEEELNLVAEFKKHPEGVAALKRIGVYARECFKEAWDANEKFRANMAEIWKLFSGVLDPKAPPYQHMANAHVPILMENTVRMVSRQAFELFGNWTQVFGVVPIGPTCVWRRSASHRGIRCVSIPGRSGTTAARSYAPSWRLASGAFPTSSAA